MRQGEPSPAQASAATFVTADDLRLLFAMSARRSGNQLAMPAVERKKSSVDGALLAEFTSAERASRKSADVEIRLASSRADFKS